MNLKNIIQSATNSVGSSQSVSMNDDAGISTQIMITGNYKVKVVSDSKSIKFYVNNKLEHEVIKNNQNLHPAGEP